MKIFFDTEFTGLVPNTTLISLGMVTEHGEKFYAEFTDYDRELVAKNDWIQDNVISKLILNDRKYIENGVYMNPEHGNSKRILGDTAHICKALDQWLFDVSMVRGPYLYADSKMTFDFEQIQLVGDACHYDMYLLCNQVFGGAFNLPANVNPVCYDICQELTMLDMTTYRDIFDVRADAGKMKWAFDSSREELCKIFTGGKLPDGDKHNALYDAEVIKMIYEGISR